MKKFIFISTILASLISAPTVFAGEIININKADIAALDSLDGIGEKKAEAIVAYRTEHGEFKSLEDLKEVPGIGDKLYDKVKDSISLTEGASTIQTGAEKADTAKAKIEDKATKSTKPAADKAAAAEKMLEKPVSKADNS